MKNDRYSFPLVTLVILAGVVLAFVNPAKGSHGTTEQPAVTQVETVGQ